MGLGPRAIALPATASALADRDLCMLEERVLKASIAGGGGGACSHTQGEALPGSMGTIVTMTGMKEVGGGKGLEGKVVRTRARVRSSGVLLVSVGAGSSGLLCGRASEGSGGCVSRSSCGRPRRRDWQRKQRKQRAKRRLDVI